ncbi:cryptochrome/photolyase family protein, partial [Escherichia coli]|uniref:cryptochrome/photolyase family protein n=1 Tax=Escherichia coli TaxID=562 RepID=UPI000CAA9422
FYTARDEAALLFDDRRQWLMEHFYRQMRSRHGVLMAASGKPLGGQWNFDQDNRKPWPGLPREPADARCEHDHSALWETIRQAGIASFGEPNAQQFRWPLNRAEALQ